MDLNEFLKVISYNINKTMNQLLFTLLVLVALVYQAAAVPLAASHESETVLGNILAEPYLAMLVSFIVLVATLI